MHVQIQFVIRYIDNKLDAASKEQLILWQLPIIIYIAYSLISVLCAIKAPFVGSNLSLFRSVGGQRKQAPMRQMR